MGHATFSPLFSIVYLYLFATAVVVASAFDMELLLLSPMYDIQLGWTPRRATLNRLRLGVETFLLPSIKVLSPWGLCCRAFLSFSKWGASGACNNLSFTPAEKRVKPQSISQSGSPIDYRLDRREVLQCHWPVCYRLEHREVLQWLCQFGSWLWYCHLSSPFATVIDCLILLWSCVASFEHLSSS